MCKHLTRLSSTIIQGHQNPTKNIIVLHGLMGSNKNFQSIMKNITQKTPYKVTSLIISQAHLLNLRNHANSFHSDSMSF